MAQVDGSGTAEPDSENAALKVGGVAGCMYVSRSDIATSKICSLNVGWNEVRIQGRVFDSAPLGCGCHP